MFSGCWFQSNTKK